MKWFQIKEKSAGEKRLILTYFIYKILGFNAVKIIVFFVGMITFISNKDIREYSRKTLQTIFDFSKKTPKPNFINQFRHVLSYSYSLADKMRIFAGDYPHKKILFASKEAEEILLDDFKNKKGIFFITTHIGNIDVLRCFLNKNFEYNNVKVNVFLSESQSKTFNNFIKQIELKNDINIIPVENIDISTAVDMQERINQGEIIFMAGDRLSENNETTYNEFSLFNKKIKIPIGTFKLAQLTESKTYFVSALKTKNDCYMVYLKESTFDKNLRKSDSVKKVQQEYIEFLKEITLISPLQFYHFYEIFE